ncbi:MAG: NADH-quinone oxidoreductase subunit M [Cytophagales bacterium]|nr:NADH-quinone oxidoreductase subunit M [Cytophagales bacterium]
MITALLLYLPAFAAILTVLFKRELAKYVAFIFALVEFVISITAALAYSNGHLDQLSLDYYWIPNLGISFKIGLDGISLLLVLLTTFLVPIIILSTFNSEKPYPSSLYTLVLAMQTGLIGVFVSLDCFLFYVFWEVALIPVYFIAAIWGGSDKIRITFKFFIYTILGSFIMLLGILYLYFKVPGGSFDHILFSAVNLNPVEQLWVFLAFFAAFAIKVPVFPFHSWQPDTYTESPTVATMLLSGIMLKMGVFGFIRWVIPVVPLGFNQAVPVVIILAVVGMIYGSIIAIMQKDMKRLVAFSSMAHVGLIAAGIFAGNLQSLQGAVIQMLNHGVNAVGLFFILEIIYRRTKTREISELGGLINQAPVLSIFFVIILLGNVAMPLTNSFVGEFLLLNGLFQYNKVLAAAAGITVIIGAVYMLRMYKNIMLGETKPQFSGVTDITLVEAVTLVPIVAVIVIMGIYPDPFLQISEPAVQSLINTLNTAGAVVAQ